VTNSNDCESKPSFADDAIADLPLSDLSRMIRNREITSKKLVEIYLDRIGRFDGPEGINSYITIAADRALRDAEDADRLTQIGKPKGLLHGLPLAIKDNFETRGIRTTAGSKVLASWVPTRDAHVVGRLRRAGAVILGKTNMHEFALGVTSDNPHYGPVRNPYDPSRIPGGSSGGSGAATAAALCAATLGTDTGGSVRIPAGLCGVVGLKPTLGRVGTSGVVPLSFSRDCVGPITRTVLDAAIILEVIAGKDRRDPVSSNRPVPRYTDLPGPPLAGKVFGLPRRFIAESVDPDTERIFNASVERIEEIGGIVREIDIKYIDLAPDADSNIVKPEAACLIEAYLRRIDPRIGIAECLHQMGADVRDILSSQTGSHESRPIPAHVYIGTLHEQCEKMKAGFKEALSGIDALLFPTTPFPACKIGEDPSAGPGGKMNTFLTYVRNCVPMSVVGYPAISVPAGYSRKGLPIGLEIVCRPWEESKLLALAYAFEQATRARKPPRL
jgi:aspartyl-tRNA(Asn)/glutamyl-tRNA(Gln) amidotransferase subunit A